MNRIFVELLDGSRRALRSASELHTIDRRKTILLMVERNGELCSYLSQIPDGVLGDIFTAVDTHNTADEQVFQLKDVFGWYYTEPIGLRLSYYRREKAERAAKWTNYYEKVLDYVPAIEDYFDQLEAEVESMTALSNRFEYDWTTSYIYLEDTL